MFSIPAVTQAQVILANLASKYGYYPQSVSTYNRKFRNPALSYLSAERILILYTNGGLAAVQKELDILRARHVI